MTRGGGIKTGALQIRIHKEENLLCRKDEQRAARRHTEYCFPHLELNYAGVEFFSLSQSLFLIQSTREK